MLNWCNHFISGILFLFAMHHTVIDLTLAVLLVSPLMSGHELPDYSHEGILSDERVLDLERDSLGSNQPRRLNLEDPTDWSASGEVMDKNHAWYRRRRDVGENMNAAESAVFIPPYIRIKKKSAQEECHRRNNDFLEWRRHQTHPYFITGKCNEYCCYPLVIESTPS